MTKRTFLIAARLFFSLLTLGVLIAQLVVHIQYDFNVVNYFSYFTNLSNLFAAIVMLIGAAYVLQRRQPTLKDDLTRGSSVAAMAVVGIVFSLLLRHADVGALMPWVNTVTHYIMPVAAFADWLYQPPELKLTLRQIPYWMIYPLTYLFYVLIRGALIGWYPYPFLNPANVGGYLGVLVYIISIIGLFLLISVIIILLGNKLKLNVA